MENPFTHNRATNLIGQVLDEEAKRLELAKKDPKDKDSWRFASLEYIIMMRLFNAGCLTPRAEETVGLEGRHGDAPTETGDPSLA